MIKRPIFVNKGSRLNRLNPLSRKRKKPDSPGKSSTRKSLPRKCKKQDSTDESTTSHSISRQSTSTESSNESGSSSRLSSSEGNPDEPWNKFESPDFRSLLHERAMELPGLVEEGAVVQHFDCWYFNCTDKHAISTSVVVNNDNTRRHSMLVQRLSSKKSEENIIEVDARRITTATTSRKIGRWLLDREVRAKHWSPLIVINPRHGNPVPDAQATHG